MNEKYYIAYIDQTQHQAVCITDDEDLIRLPLKLLPEDIVDSKVVQLNNGDYEIDAEETAKRFKLNWRIKMLRIEKQLTQEEVAEVLKCSASDIGAFEEGQRKPNFLQLLQLSRLFDADLEFMIGKTDLRIEYIPFPDFIRHMSLEDKEKSIRFVKNKIDGDIDL